MEVTFKAKPFKISESWAVTIPKQYLKDGYIDPTKEIKVTVSENEEDGIVHD